MHTVLPLERINRENPHADTRARARTAASQWGNSGGEQGGRAPLMRRQPLGELMPCLLYRVLYSSLLYSGCYVTSCSVAVVEASKRLPGTRELSPHGAAASGLIISSESARPAMRRCGRRRELASDTPDASAWAYSWVPSGGLDGRDSVDIYRAPGRKKGHLIEMLVFLYVFVRCPGSCQKGEVQWQNRRGGRWNVGRSRCKRKDWSLGKSGLDKSGRTAD